jgi:TonB family protein
VCLAVVSREKEILEFGLRSELHFTVQAIAEPSGCESFDKEALRLARKIKFKPAVKDGVPITVVKTTEYGAYIY